MINLKSLETLKLEKISSALHRRKWGLPLLYDLEYLGGFYENPIPAVPDGPVGIALYYGRKTGDKEPVTLELSCTKGVLLPGARHATSRYHKPTAARANALCRLIGLPPLLGQAAVNPVETWQSVFPECKPQLFRCVKGFELVLEHNGTLVTVYIGAIAPLKGPRYAAVDLYDAKRVAKNCPRNEQTETLGFIRKPGEPLRGKSLMDPGDFSRPKAGDRRVWNHRISNPLGEFSLELHLGDQPVWPPNPRVLDAALELALFAEENDDLIRDIVFGDYRRVADRHPDQFAKTDVPPSLRRRDIRDHLARRALVIEPNPDSPDKPCRSFVRVQPKWRGSEDLNLETANGRITSVNGKAFKLRDEVLWCEGDAPLKPRPRTAPSPEAEDMAKFIGMMPLHIEEGRAPRPLSARVKKLIAAAKAAGFVHLGWLDVIMVLPLSVAAFTNADGSVYLSIATSELLETESVDLVSHLDGNRQLTTTNFKMVMPQPDRGIFKYSHPKADIGELLGKHHQHLRKLNARAEVRGNTLKDFEASIRQHLQQENQARCA